MDNDLSPQDADMMARTIIGEAGNQSTIGQAAVAHVILNRASAGNYGGNNPTSVVLAPNQFEPWSTRASELSAIPTTSPAYQSALAIAKGAASGDIPDPTQGATYFMNENTVRQRNGGTIPQKWAQGAGTQIGDHTFFQPKSMNNTPDYLSAYVSGQPTSATQTGITNTPDYLSDYVASTPVVQQDAAPPKQMIGNREVTPSDLSDSAPTKITIHPRNSYLQEFQDRVLGSQVSPSAVVGQAASDYLDRLSQLANQNASTMGTGLKNITSGSPATGVGQFGLGALGYLFSPASAIDAPITNMTGNPDFGEKASMMVPTGGIGKVANAARPTVSSLTDIVKDIGQENIPQVIDRLQSNPNLTLMDVAPTVRGNAAGLATDPRNAPAMNALNQFQQQRMAARPADTTNIFQDALGPTPNMANTINSLKQAAADTGKNMIEPAIAVSKPVDVSGIINNLDKQLPPSTLSDLKAGTEPPALPDESKRIWSLRERLRGDTPEGLPVVIDPKTAHELQMELRRTSSDPQIGFQARKARRELVDAIDKSSSGTYKPALKQYAEDKAVEDAFREGFNIFSNPTSAEGSIANHPDVWKEWMKDASDVEKKAVAKGILFGANNKIANARRGIDVPDNSYAHQRIASVIGQKNADEIVRRLGDWRDIAETDNLLTKNSATALRQAGQQARSVREVDPNAVQKWTLPVIAGLEGLHATGSPLIAGAALGGLRGGAKLLQMAGKAHDIATNTAYAKWAAATGAKKQDLIDVLKNEASRSSEPSSMQKLINLAPPSIMQALPR